jgi:hypothetical protein
MLFTVYRNVGIFSLFATSLSEVLDYPSACINHDLIVQHLVAIGTTIPLALKLGQVFNQLVAGSDVTCGLLATPT